MLPPEQVPDPLIALLVNEVRNGKVRPDTGTIHPNPLLLLQSGPDTHRTENEALVLHHDFQCIARADPQRSTHSLRQDKSAGLVQCCCGVH